MASSSSKKENRSMVVAMFRDRSDASQAYAWLLARGYSDSEINVLMSNETRSYFEQEEGKHNVGSRATEGVAAGGTAGAAIGATTGAILAIGTAVLLPGIGWVAGPLLAGLAGAGAGAVTGGLIGGLVGLGIPESNAAAYEEALKNGGIVLGVVPHEGDASDIKTHFQKLHGENIHAQA
jgi:hypothetical protein